MNTDLISASEAAQLLGVHHKTVSRLMRTGKLRAVKIANRWLVDSSDVMEFARAYEPRVGRPRTRDQSEKQETS